MSSLRFSREGVIFHSLAIEKVVHAHQTAAREAAFNEIPQHAQGHEIPIQILMAPAIYFYFSFVETSSRSRKRVVIGNVLIVNHS
ncbi:hypothetical protein E8E11_000270 [Didymella keratinophila]|nr:hypothetical protein E8E11_000270 [Didymella keratinophila]